jgi:hypothetical protein
VYEEVESDEAFEEGTTVMLKFDDNRRTPLFDHELFGSRKSASLVM